MPEKTNKHIRIKQGSTRSAIVTPLKKDGEPINLTDCHVLIHIESLVDGGYAEVVDKKSNEVRYVLEENVTSSPGTHLAEFEVIYPDGRRDIFPTEGYIEVRIAESIKGR